VFRLAAGLPVEAENPVSPKTLLDLDPPLAQLDPQSVVLAQAQVVIHPLGFALRLPLSRPEPLPDRRRDLTPIEPPDFQASEHAVAL
jgi:hypothetical protein